MRRSLLHRLGLALCALPLAASLSHAQTFQTFDMSLPDVPDFTKGIDEAANPTVQAQAKLPSIESPAVSPNTGMPSIEAGQASLDSAKPKSMNLVSLALLSSDYIDPRYIENSQHHDPSVRERLGLIYREQYTRWLTSDLKNFYWSENTIYLGLAVGAAAPIANTHADQGFRDWYQRQAGQSSRANNVALAVKKLGEWTYVVPAGIAISVAGHLFPDNPFATTCADFGDRSLRALAVGAPMVGLLQIGLGPDRPFENDSRWHPFHSNHGASGHAFVGAIPFLTAAEMTEYKSLQAALFVASFATSWSRIQTDDHYLSQVLLGWTCAYLAVRSVNQTEEEAKSHVQFAPMPIQNGAGVAMVVRY